MPVPDLLTHTLAVFPFRYKFKRFISVILLGAILPDIFARIPGVLFPYRAAISWAQSVLHSPIALIFICLLVSFFFPEKIRKTVFLFLLLGIFSHLFLDLFQKTLTYGYLWFFPFSFVSFSIPLIWPNDTIFLTPFFIFLNIILVVIKARYEPER